MSVVGITDLWAYLVGCIAIVLLPGPNSLYVMSTAALAARRSAWAAVSGVLVADTLYIVGSGLGLVALLQAMPWLFDLIRWIGAAYLGWLGIVLLASAWRRFRRDDAATASGAAASIPALEPGAAAAAGTGGAASPAVEASLAANRAFRKAVAIGLLNPKALMFYVAFFPQFVDPVTGDWLTFVAMGTLLQLCSLVYLIALVFGGGALAAAARRSAWLAAFGRGATGALFLAFGARLAAARTLS